jgi:hypothetical protein
MKRAKRLGLTLFVIFILLLILFAVIPMNTTAPSAKKVTPWKGNTGKSVTIHGSGFKSGEVTVKFGQAQVEYIKIVNDKNIKVTVPEKDATDPDNVKVTVYIDGILIPGDLWFYYWPKGN